MWAEVLLNLTTLEHKSPIQTLVLLWHPSTLDWKMITEPTTVSIFISVPEIGRPNWWTTSEFSSNTCRGDMSFQFHRCASKFCRQNRWPCSPVSPTRRPAQPRWPPVINSVPAIEVHMCMYFLCRKPVTVKRNILHAGYEILYLPTTSAPPIRDITTSVYQVFPCLQQPFHIQT